MNFPQNKSDVVRQAARGRWLEILSAIAPDLKDAVKACPNHVLDPVHGGKNADGFRLFKDANLTGGGISNIGGAKPDGFTLLMWVLNIDFKTALNDVADYLGINDQWKKQSVTPKTAVRSEDYQEYQCVDEQTLEKRRYALRTAWKQAFPINAPQALLARKYLASRGLDVSKLNLEQLSKTMRLHPSLALWHKDRCLGRFPAIVTLVSYSDGKAACIHRTYLDHKGQKLKMIVDGESISTKKLMARCENRSLTGGAIRLGTPNSDEIDVSEGIETALSVMQAKQKAVWPCVSSTILAKFEPPQGVKRVVIWADKDRPKVSPNGTTKTAGIDAANELVDRLEKKGIKATIKLPDDAIPNDAKSVDWNDVLVKHGETPFSTNQIYPNS